MIGVAFKGDETIIKSNQHVYQWDTGQKIMVSGLGDSNINQVHFSFNGLKTAYPVNVTNSSGTVTVNIPNIVLRYGKDVYMYLCIKNTNGTVVTIKTVIIPVIKRNMPENYMYDDNETVAVKLDELQTEIQRSTGVDTDHENRITTLEGGKNSVTPFLWSSTEMRVYDGAIHSGSHIYLGTQDNLMMFDYCLTVDVTGTGGFLYWRMSDNTFIMSNDSNIVSNDVYFIGLTKFKQFNNVIQFSALTCAYPAFTFDFIGNKLYIDFKYYGYIFYNGDVITIPRNYKQELSYLGGL